MSNIQVKVLTDAQGNDYLKYTPANSATSVTLTKWVCETYYDALFIKTSFGEFILNHKVSATEPIETQNGTRTTADEVRSDIGINSSGAGASYDETLGADKVSLIHDLSDQYTDFEALVAAQDLTASYADFGAVIDMRGYTVIGVKVAYDVNDSLNVSLKVVGCDADGTNEFELSTIDVWALWTTVVADGTKYNIFDVGSIPYCKIKGIAGTVGATTAGDLTITTNKIWRA